jgi:hypothetical protein
MFDLSTVSDFRRSFPTVSSSGGIGGSILRLHAIANKLVKNLKRGAPGGGHTKKFLKKFPSLSKVLNHIVPTKIPTIGRVRKAVWRRRSVRFAMIDDGLGFSLALVGRI